MRLALTLFLTLFSLQAAGAEFSPWMAKAYKNATPNELAYYVGVSSECSISKEDTTAILEGVLVRSRVRPLGGVEWRNRRLYLLVELVCLKRENNNPPFQLAIYFGNYSEAVPMLYDKNYGVFGLVVGNGNVKTVLRELVEAAVTDYLKANFDQGD